MPPPIAIPLSGSPVRKIGRRFRSARGRTNVHGCRIAFESALERDFLELLDADPTIEEVVGQPLTIHYPDPKTGKLRGYTPDVFVRHGPPNPGAYLFEVKYREELRREFWTVLKPKFLAARRHCRENGWKFVIRTEVEVRGPKVANHEFLRRYAGVQPDAAIEEQLAAVLAAIGPSTPQALLAATLWHDENKARAIPHLWRMIRCGRIEADLALPLTMSSRIAVTVGEGYLWTDPYAYR